jgi:hypothetical protein
MRSIKGSLVGLVLAGILALAPTAVFAHGGGGGHFAGGHFAGFAGHSFAGHSFAQHQGAHFARTEIISGTSEIPFLEIPFGMITHTMGMIIRTTAMMMTMLATIPRDNPQQPKRRLLSRPLLPCRRS